MIAMIYDEFGRLLEAESISISRPNTTSIRDDPENGYIQVRQGITIITGDAVMRHPPPLAGSRIMVSDPDSDALYTAIVVQTDGVTMRFVSSGPPRPIVAVEVGPDVVVGE